MDFVHAAISQATQAVPPVETIVVQGVTYIVDEKIGEGAFSTVHRCHNIQKSASPENSVAIKRMQLGNDKARAGAAKQELELAAMVGNGSNPNIVRCVGYEIRSYSQAYLVLEHCSDSLVNLMKSVQQKGHLFTQDTVIRIFCSVVNAVVHLHGQSPPITHRDIKAENVLISSNDEFKLTDFGSATREAYECRNPADVAKAQDELDRHTTLQYRSPEMIDLWRGHRIDQSADVWALGVLLYYLCYFRLPFDETKLAILNSQLVFPAVPSYDSNILESIRHCLVSDPTKRWSVFHLAVHLQKSFPNLTVSLSGVTVPIKLVQQPLVTSVAPLSPSSDPPPCGTTNSKNDLFSKLLWNGPPGPKVGVSPTKEQTFLSPQPQEIDLFALAPEKKVEKNAQKPVSTSLFDDWPTSPQANQKPAPTHTTKLNISDAPKGHVRKDSNQAIEDVFEALSVSQQQKARTDPVAPTHPESDHILDRVFN